MTRKIIKGLVLLNILLAAALTTTPLVSQVFPRGLWNCCQSGMTDSEDEFCCYACCWWIRNCSRDSDCSAN